MMIKWLTNSPWFIYLKIALLVAIVAGASYLAWETRGAFADREKNKAVKDAVHGINLQLEAERKLRVEYEGKADIRHEALLKSISKMQEDFKQIRGNLDTELKSNPKFYEQPLPAGGYEQWKRARDLLKSSNTPATQP